MMEVTKERWWGRTLFGVVALIFGLAFLLVPGFTLTLFLYVFGFFMILAGLVLIGFAWRRPTGSRHRTLNFAEGAINIVIGIIALLAPGITALFAIYLVGVFAIIAGILQIAEGLIAPRGTQTFGASNRWLLVISGVWALLIGILLVVFPGGGILALLWLVGIFLIVLGLFNIVTGIRMRSAPMPTVTR
jgi:uncharacterized membrane protein HdeD (DUF308 family)